jgi:hypothetical protein
MRILALGHFDYSRHVLVALAQHGADVHYGYLGTPTFLPESSARLEVFPVSRADREREVAAAVRRVGPEVILVGTASYDGSNRVALDLLDAGTPVPVVRFYKEFRLRPSVPERDVLRGVDALVAGGEREAAYFRSVYHLDPDRIHVFDPDVISSDLIPADPLPRLSGGDGEPHVVLGGNLKADDSEFDYRRLFRALADGGVHVHVYALGYSRWISPGRVLDPQSQEVRAAYQDLWDHPYLHPEAPVFGAEQLRRWSRYDAGLTQRPPDVFRPELTPVQEMNLPSKYSYYLGAGLPIVVHRRNLPTLRQLLAAGRVLLEYDDVEELAHRLHDLAALAEMGAAARRLAPSHTAQAAVPALLSFVEGILRRPRAGLGR